MKSDSLAPIPIPWQLRWHTIRLRVIPVVVFSLVLLAMIGLWQEYVAAPTMTGQAEPVLANVSCAKAGVLAELSVTRFQRVKAGDPVGRVMVADAQVLAASLAVIQAETESIRSLMKPINDQQRKVMDYDQLRLDWMKDRAQLATARVNLDLAETEFRRMEELFKDKIVAQRVYEAAKSTRDKRTAEVESMAKVVDQGEQSLKNLQLSNSVDITTISTDPMRAAIAVQDSKLRLAEAELSPVTLRAPIDGIVSVVLLRPGEAVTAGKPIISIATLNPVRIVGYLRSPITDEPKVGMKVEVRTRGLKREVGSAEIIEVGTQLEPLPPSLAGSLKLVTAELGLPVDISIPPSMKIRPGEVVDITLFRERK